MKKKVIIILACVVLVISISAVFLYDILQYNTGVVTKITAKAQDGDELNLEITYFLPMGKYSVRGVAEDEGEFCGDGIKDYDGSLGKHRIMMLSRTNLLQSERMKTGYLKLKIQEVH